MSTIQWSFFEMPRQLINQGSTSGEFFNSENDDSSADALVREAIQNSLDASQVLESGERSKVSVRILVSSHNQHLLPSKAEDYFSTLWPHLQSDSTIRELPDRKSPVSFIAIEDFGTKGLRGNPAQEKDGKGDSEFFYFWRNVGRGMKSGNELGRWGLGKTVFPNASKLRSFFGLTVRQGEEDALLMGQSELDIHSFDGKRYSQYGWWGITEADGFVLPLHEGKRVQSFRNDFHLQRQLEPGLSIVVPYLQDDLTPESIVRSIIHHYFFPILADKLEVKVEFHDQLVEINGTTIEQVAAKYFEEKENESFRRVLELTLWALTNPEEERSILKLSGAGSSPRWNEALFEEHSLDNYRASFFNGTPIAVRAPLIVQQDGHEPNESFFDIYIRSEESQHIPEEYYIRRGVRITDIRALRERGLIGLVVIDDGPLVSMLGDAENPAHREWQKRSPKFRGKYIRGPSTLDFVKNSLREIVRILNQTVGEVDKELLSHIFWIEHPKDEKDKKVKKKSDTDEPGPEVPDPPEPPKPNPRDYSVRVVDDGFLISSTSKSINYRLSVRVAYDTRTGNPFRKYSEFDFDLSELPIEIICSHAKVHDISGNRFIIEPIQDSYQVKVTGFDNERDIIVKVDKRINTDEA